MNIEITQLSKTYGRGAKAVRALCEVDLTIGPGMFGLLGPNGAGKTTLMRILAGLVNPTAGKAVAAGHDLATERGKVAVKAILGYLPQELGLYPELSARQFLDYMAILKGLDEGEARRARVGRTLELVGLADVAERKLKGFSGGMKRRVGIAQALLNDPQIMIVDEPTAGLDPEERIRFRNLLVDLASDRIVILSTHIVEDISQTCRDMAILDHGQVRFRGSPAELIARAQGMVWQIQTDNGHKPNNGLVVVSTLQLADGVQYRVVGQDVSGYPGAKPAQPSLEDGYVWLMQGVGDTASAS
ncbi:MAG TPA: ABC transporter ATP-binding protein [Anaerolineae bacterium]|nr:ABC transporter ATP-binding protein [Anaerolineae bacterium]HOQ97821.1 ABC transporter ATP-binding protein [Anaerolineae bacterium]HPL28945.1 ABC transporter ATP-binding protein [Anaerolineae bacterium]